jgi:hypothetical protein
MMYGLTYLYRASDFFEVVETFQPESVLFTAYWCQLDKSHLADCYEFAFMGAFGMGYKLLVLGEERAFSPCVDSKGLDGERVIVCSNRDLWATAETVRQSALGVWRGIVRKGASDGKCKKSLLIRIGFLYTLDLVETALVDMDAFLKDKVPERVPVVCGAVGAAFVVKDTEGSE